MSDSANVTVVRRLYDARGNPDIIQQVLAPDIRWEVVEAFRTAACTSGSTTCSTTSSAVSFRTSITLWLRALSFSSPEIASLHWGTTRDGQRRPGRSSPRDSLMFGPCKEARSSG